ASEYAGIIGDDAIRRAEPASDGVNLAEQGANAIGESDGLATNLAECIAGRLHERLEYVGETFERAADVDAGLKRRALQVSKPPRAVGDKVRQCRRELAAPVKRAESDDRG